MTVDQLDAAAEVAALVGAAGFALLLIGLPRVLESWQAARQVTAAQQHDRRGRDGQGTWFPSNAPYERRYADPGSRPSNELHTGPSRPHSAAHTTPVRDGDPGE